MNFAKNKLEDPIKHSQSVVYSGSSVIGLKYNKGIIIACDTRMSYGSSLSLVSTNERIKALNKRTLIGYSGEFSDMQETSRILNELILEDQLETNGKDTKGPVELGHYLSSLHYRKRNNLDPYLNSAIVGGIDFNGDIVLMQVDPFGTFLTANYFTTAFANYFACSLLRNNYPKNPKDLTKDKALDLIMKCFEVLFYRDCNAGDTIQFKVMEKDNNGVPNIESGVYKLKTKWEYKQFMQGNEKNYLVA
jgi:20S proteasome subunit beta 7